MFTFVRLAYLNFSFFFAVKTIIYPFGFKNISLPLRTLGLSQPFWTVEFFYTLKTKDNKKFNTWFAVTAEHSWYVIFGVYFCHFKLIQELHDNLNNKHY